MERLKKGKVVCEQEGTKLYYDYMNICKLNITSGKKVLSVVSVVELLYH